MEIDVLNQLILSIIKQWFLLSLAVFLLARSRSTSASGLHALLLLVLLSAALLPVLTEYVPGLRFFILPDNFSVQFLWSYSDAANRIFTLAGSAYLLVAASLWLRRLMQIRRVHVLWNDAADLAITAHLKFLQNLCSRLAIKQQVHLRYSDEIATPLTFGDVRPRILLPRESLVWDEHKLRRFLVHEITHIARRDWFIKQLSYLVVGLFWIVPPAWRVLTKLEWLAELACDDIVIATEGRRSDYADDLLDITASKTFAGAIGLTEAHNHYDRIAAVLDGGRIRHSNQMKCLLHALVFLMVLLLVAGIQLATIKPAKNIEHFQLQPLVLLEHAEPPAVRETIGDTVADPDPGPLADKQSQPVLPLPIADLNVKFEVKTTIDEVWSGAAADVLQPLVKVVPEYPRRALRRGREGVVEVAYSILPTGETAQISIRRAQPAGVFDKAAIDAIKQYRYAPQERAVHGVNEVFEFRLIEDAP